MHFLYFWLFMAVVLIVFAILLGVMNYDWGITARLLGCYVLVFAIIAIGYVAIRKDCEVLREKVQIQAETIMEEKEAEFKEVKQKKQEGYTVYKDEKEVGDLNSIDVQKIRAINIDNDNKCIYVY